TGMRFRRRGAVLLLLCQSAWGATSWTLGNIPSDYQGRFGTQHTIGIFYDPTFLQYQSSDLRLKLTVPYISVSNLPVGAQVTNGTLSTRTKSTQTKTASGLGDIWLAAHYTLVPERGLQPALVPYAKIKLGTAQASQGLGTGQNDYEAGLGFNTTIGANMFPFAHIGYRFVGSPAGQNLQNIATYDAGVSVAVNLRNIWTVMYSGAQSEQPGYSGPSDAIVAWNYNVTVAGSGFQVYLDKGLSNGSANIGGGVGGQVVF
ncbi:MAG: transporter, partial [Acidiferrobacter sp.]